MLELYPRSINVLYLLRNSQNASVFAEIAQAQKIRIEWVQKEQLSHWLPNVNHQGIAIAYDRLPSLTLQMLLDRCNQPGYKPLLLLLDRIQDPQNLGACLRSAAAFGVDGIIIPKDKAVGLTPTVAKIAVGAAAIVPVISVTNLSRTIRLLKESGFWIYGTSEHASESIEQADVSMATAWVMGNEAKGLSQNVEKQCDQLFSIHTSGFSTLNIATSTSICLYQTFSNRHVSDR